jgi:SPP1 gp7 family putative phage head morphogenesis protein
VSTVARAIAQGRQQMRAMEPGMVQQLLDAYDLAWRAVDRELEIVLGRIEAAVAAGEMVSEAWLQRQAWWRQTQDSIEREMARFRDQGTRTIARAQARAVQEARMVGIGYLSAIDIPFAGHVHPGAMEQWVSAIQPYSPIRDVLDGYGTRVSQSLQTRITEGIGSGQGTKAITRAVVRDVGTDAVEGRLHTLVRTEAMRAYRGSHRADMEALAKEIPGKHEWEWFAALSPRTCPACLAMHGRRFPFRRYPNRFHVGCRCVVRLILAG